ncbi:phage tail protein [Kiloniella sp. b19]|uniref:phage tail protein n=1 Tax=Kiloniella sp. GXU_MW_B19 TaxID=3141326 RepID=UPI0031E1AB07
MLMSLGLYVFQLKSAPISKIDRTTKQNWAVTQRVGKRPATQHIGPSDDTITLTGALAPEITGKDIELETLRDMMRSGKAWILTTGTGQVLGPWIILEIKETRRHLTNLGQARFIDFTLSLRRYGEDQTSELGAPIDSAPPDLRLALGNQQQATSNVPQSGPPPRPSRRPVSAERSEQQSAQVPL